MSPIVLYFLYSTSVLSFCIDIVLTLSILMARCWLPDSGASGRCQYTGIVTWHVSRSRIVVRVAGANIHAY